MSRQSVRVGVAQLLASLTDTSGSPLFAAVFPVMPMQIDERLTPAAFVMAPHDDDVRNGPQKKLVQYTTEIRIYYAKPQVGWQSPSAGTSLFVAPDTEPQTLFDAFLDAVKVGLRANKSFPQNTPPLGQVILIGEPKISTDVAEPEPKDGYLAMGAVMSFPVVEQVLGT